MKGLLRLGFLLLCGLGLLVCVTIGLLLYMFWRFNVGPDEAPSCPSQ